MSNPLQDKRALPSVAASRSETTEHGITAATRTSLAAPRAKLFVPPIPGYHTHWFRGGIRVEQAIQAGYEFVKKGDVPVANHGIASSREDTDGSDLGSRISVIAGGVDVNDGQPQRLYLMKIKQEWRAEDMKSRQARNELLVDALKRGDAGKDQAQGLDLSHRKPGLSNRNLFSKRS